MNNGQDLASFIMALGTQAQTKRNPKLAPGGLSSARPAPTRMNAADGVSDSSFVQQIIQAAQEIMGGPSEMPPMQQPPMQQTMQQPMQQQSMQQQGAPQAGGAAGIQGLLSMLGGKR